MVLWGYRALSSAVKWTLSLLMPPCLVGGVIYEWDENWGDAGSGDGLEGRQIDSVDEGISLGIMWWCMYNGEAG